MVLPLRDHLPGVCSKIRLKTKRLSEGCSRAKARRKVESGKEVLNQNADYVGVSSDCSLFHAACGMSCAIPWTGTSEPADR